MQSQSVASVSWVRPFVSVHRRTSGIDTGCDVRKLSYLRTQSRRIRYQQTLRDVLPSAEQKCANVRVLINGIWNNSYAFSRVCLATNFWPLFFMFFFLFCSFNFIYLCLLIFSFSFSFEFFIFILHNLFSNLILLTLHFTLLLLIICLISIYFLFKHSFMCFVYLQVFCFLLFCLLIYFILFIFAFIYVFIITNSFHFMLFYWFKSWISPLHIFLPFIFFRKYLFLSTLQIIPLTKYLLLFRSVFPTCLKRILFFLLPSLPKWTH